MRYFIILILGCLISNFNSYNNYGSFKLKSKLDPIVLDSIFVKQSSFRSFNRTEINHLKNFCIEKHGIELKRFYCSYMDPQAKNNVKAFVISCNDENKEYDLLFIYSRDSIFSYLEYTGDFHSKLLGYTYFEDSAECFVCKSFRVNRSALDSVIDRPILSDIRHDWDTSFCICDLKKK
jgi:hypothetical protein